eukprot:1173757-Prorocentrum_minimum.AAC.2
MMLIGSLAARLIGRCANSETPAGVLRKAARAATEVRNVTAGNIARTKVSKESHAASVTQPILTKVDVPSFLLGLAILSDGRVETGVSTLHLCVTRTIQPRRANAPSSSKFPNGVAAQTCELSVNYPRFLVKPSHQGLAQGR